MRQSRWDTQGSDESQQDTASKHVLQEYEEPPPLPPDDPPPLPPPEEPSLDTNFPSQQVTWTQSEGQQPNWPEQNAHVHQNWHSIGSSHHQEDGGLRLRPSKWETQNIASSVGPQKEAPNGPGQLPDSSGPVPAETWMHAPPPGPPGPPSGAPWQQASDLQNGELNTTGSDPSQQAPDPPLPPPQPDSAPWQDYSAAGEAQAAQGNQQWDANQAWYQGYYGYQSYSADYNQQNSYGAYPQEQYQQQPGGNYGYEGQSQYAAAPAYPWTQPQGQTNQSAVPTKNEIDAADIMRPPGRHHRSGKIAVIMRGLPGSGKSHIAKKLREIEAEQGGEPPRIHSIDDYFVTEVEKEITDEQPGMRPKKRKITVMEYLYEQELEDSYRASLLKAFTKTVEEGRFPFVILDAPNIQVEEFRPFYMAAQRMGYDVYVLKPLETNPDVCFNRNVHQRDQDTISDLAALYEPTPNLYPQILVESLFDLPKRKEDADRAIEEVDMEEEGRELEDTQPQPQVKSRWADLEEEVSQEEEAPRKKKRRKQEGAEAETDPAPASETGKVARRSSAASILKQAGGAPSNKVVRWADEVAPAEGFTIGASMQQLEEVYLLEGLGPTPESNHTGLTHQSFVEMARKERTTEKHSFKDILLGKRSA